MKTRNVWSILATGALVLSACGGSDATDAGSEADDVELAYESPLGEFLGWDQGADFDEEAAQAEWAEQEREVQEAVASCMSEQGFEYVPIDSSAQTVFFEEQFGEGLEWGSGEWTAKYGFGVSTQRFSQEQVGPDLVGNNYSAQSIGEEGFSDPNQEYVESLGENEQQAYFEALYGGNDQYPTPAWEEEGREPTQEEMEAFDQEWQENYTPSGCEPVASDAIYNNGDGAQAQYEEFDAEFGEVLREMEERMESHPDVIAFRDDIRVCVEERGLEFLTDQESYQHFEQELNTAGLGWEDEQDPLEGIDTTDFTDEDYERAWIESQKQLLSPEKLVALGEVQANEIATAVALQECGGGWQNEQAGLQSVRIELEEEFLATNADRLAEFEGVFGN